MNEALLTKLEGMIKLLDNQVTKEDFVSAFENVLKIVVQIEKKTSEAVTSLEQTYQQMISRMQNDHSSTLTDLKGQVNALFVEDKVKTMQSDHAKRMSTVDEKLKNMDMRMANVRNGYTPVKGKDYFDGQPGKSVSLSDIQDMVTTIINEEIAIQADKLRKSQVRLGGGGFSKIAMDSHHIDDETPTGTINGSNKVFKLSNTPNPDTSLKVYLGGARQRLTEDYTLSVRTITFIIAPPTGSILLVDYRV